MIRTLRVMSASGDTLIAEWDTETVSNQRLNEITREYDTMVKDGYIPADITDKRDEIVRGEAFNPNADTLMIPRMQGGAD